MRTEGARLRLTSCRPRLTAVLVAVVQQEANDRFAHAQKPWAKRLKQHKKCRRQFNQDSAALDAADKKYKGAKNGEPCRPSRAHLDTGVPSHSGSDCRFSHSFPPHIRHCRASRGA